jgi:glycosyltransferase involved in cell wall biosynthesis
MCSLRFGRRFIVRFHGGDLYSHRRRSGILATQPRIIERANLVLTVSDDGNAYLRKHYPAASQKIVTMRLGVPAQRRAAPSPEHVFRIGSISYAVPVKRLDFLLEVVHILSKDLPNVEWVHLGDGPSIPQLLKRVDALGLSSQVQFLGHLEPGRHGLYPAIEGAGLDIICNVSSFEGIPVALMEAASFGIPLLALDTGGNREIIEACSGILLPLDSSPDEVAAELLAFAKNGAITRETARASAQTGQRRHFDSATNSRALLQFIYQTMSDEDSI